MKFMFLAFVMILVPHATRQQNAELEMLKKVVLKETMNLGIFTTAPDDAQLVTNSNITMTCIIDRLCSPKDMSLCTNEDTVQWFMPNSLSPNQTYSRIIQEFTHSSKNFSTNDAIKVKLISKVIISQIGFQHEGFYQCTSSIERKAFRIRLMENANNFCQYSDQCRSMNCFRNKCRCKTLNETYVPETSSCVRRKKLGDMCEYSSECSPKHLLTLKGIVEDEDGNIECRNKICGCSESTTPVYVAFPSQEKVCLKSNLALGDKCLNTNQCQANGSYCGLDYSMKSVCQCRDGWYQYGDKCVRFRSCNSTTIGFNENFLAGYGCGENQFCRENLCLCQPKHMFNNDGDCEETNPSTEELFFKKYGWMMVFGGVLTIVLISVIALSYTITQKCRGRSGGQRVVHLHSHNNGSPPQFNLRGPNKTRR